MRRAALAVALAAAISAGCARTEREAAELCPEADAPVVDSVLLAFLSRARAAHHAADLHERAGRTEAALAALSELPSGPLPPGEPPLPEVREVLADTQARIAELEDALGRRERALESVASGLKWVPEPTYFRGRLLEVRGLIHERRAKELSEAGQAAAAEQARRAALESLEGAMKIQADVIERSLEQHDGGG